MSAALSPFATNVLCTNDDRPPPTHREADALDEADDAADERAWAEEIAERVVALWVGRAEVTPIPTMLNEASEKSRQRRH